MNMYATEILALDPVDGEMKKFAGPDVPGISYKDAERYCQNNGLGYCKVIGVHIFSCDASKYSLQDAWKMAKESQAYIQN